jgi:hypothetical protein
MQIKNMKLLAFSILVALVAFGVVRGYTGSPGLHISSHGRTVAMAENSSVPHRGGLLSQESDIRALSERNVRRGRSPAFVPGSEQEIGVKVVVDRRLADPKVAEAVAKLKDHFSDSSPVNYWIRAAMVFGTAASEGEVTPESFEMTGKVYGEVLAGEESAIASLQSGLQSLSRDDRAYRQQAFRMLSDIGLRNPELRDSVRKVLLLEASRGGTQENGIAYAALVRMNPTKEGIRDAARAFGNSPALNLANL